MDWLDSWRGSWTTGSSSTALESANTTQETDAVEEEVVASTSRMNGTASSAEKRAEKRRKRTYAMYEDLGLPTEPRRTGRLRKPSTDNNGQPPAVKRTRRSANAEDAQIASSSEASASSSPSGARVNPRRESRSDAEIAANELNKSLTAPDPTSVRGRQIRVRAGSHLTWSSRDDTRLRTAILTYAGFDPSKSTLAEVPRYTAEQPWAEIKLIFDELSLQEESSPPERSSRAIAERARTVLYRGLETSTTSLKHSASTAEGSSLQAVAATADDGVAVPALQLEAIPVGSDLPENRDGHAALSGVVQSAFIEELAADDGGGPDLQEHIGVQPAQMVTESPPSTAAAPSSAAASSALTAAEQSPPVPELIHAANATTAPSLPDSATQPSVPVTSLIASASASTAIPMSTVGSRMTVEEEAKIIELAMKGISGKRIAGLIGRCQSSVAKRIKKLRAEGRLPPPPTLPISQPDSADLPPASPVPGSGPSAQAANELEMTSTPASGVVTSPAGNAVPGEENRSMPNCAGSKDPVAQTPAPASSATAIAPNPGPVSLIHKKRFTTEEDKRITELVGTGASWEVINELPKYGGPKPPATPSAIAISPQESRPPTAVPTATAPLPPYTVEDDAIILRMYLQGNSAERIGVAIKRSAFSVQRRWAKKRDGWIAAGLLTAGDRLKMHDEQPEPPAVSTSAASTSFASEPDPFADLRTTPVAPETPKQVKATVAETAWRPFSPDPETEENDLGGFDASFYFVDDVPIDPALLSSSYESLYSEESHSSPAIRSSTPQTSSPGGCEPLEESVIAASSEVGTPSHVEDDTAMKVASVMPHYEAGMAGLNRFLQLLDGGKSEKPQ
ncbi:hypothetical protein JCM10908_006650 [Rhodotorula pacifica]|uniref:uncharacterized protein n=1 Tax=Rhodotorula pacifica TaxID=1495444 RepID=UPI00316BBA5B